MISKEIILVFAVFLSGVYLIIASLAFRHITDEVKKGKEYVLLIMDVWWPFYSSVYNPAARKFCIAGKVLLPVILGLYIWYALLVY